MGSNILAELKDIHQPSAVSFWPLAPGWYLLFGLLIIAVIFLAGIAYKNWLRKKYKQQILAQLDQLQLQYQTGDKREALIQLSVLLRRATLDCFPRHKVAGLHGYAWLNFLNQHCAPEFQATLPFTKGCGQLLISAPYQAEPVENVEALFTLVKSWITHNLFGNHKNKVHSYV